MSDIKTELFHLISFICNPLHFTEGMLNIVKNELSKVIYITYLYQNIVFIFTLSYEIKHYNCEKGIKKRTTNDQRCRF